MKFSSPVLANNQLTQQQQQQQQQYSLHQAAQQSSIRKQQQQGFPTQQLPTNIAPTQLPTNQNQYGNVMNNQMTGQNASINANMNSLPNGNPVKTNTSVPGAKLLPGLKASPEDWNLLKNLYRETLSAPINLKDVTASLTDEQKTKVLALAKQSKQLMILCQSIIIPNFFFLTKQTDATKRIIYSELMLKQILEKLSMAGKFVADESLINRIHEQVKKYLQFVREQSNKIVKAQQLEQQQRAQQQQQQINAGAPPKGIFNQPQPNVGVSSIQGKQMQQQQMINDPSQLIAQMNSGSVKHAMLQQQRIGSQAQIPAHNLQHLQQNTQSSPLAPSIAPTPVPSSLNISGGKQSNNSTPAAGQMTAPAAKKPRRKNTKATKAASNTNTPTNNNSKPTPTSNAPTSTSGAGSPRSVSATQAASNVNSAEINAVLKANQENIAKEEGRLLKIEVARAQRRNLVSLQISSTNSSKGNASSPTIAAKSSTANDVLTGAAAYFLSTLCDTLGLESDEKKIVSSAKGASIVGSKSKSTKDTTGDNNGHVKNKSSVTNSKALTPSAILATPIGLNAKTPIGNRFSTPGMISGNHKILPWSGKISAHLISSAFKAVLDKDLCFPISRNVNAGKSKTNNGSNVSTAVNATPITKSMSAGNTTTFYEAFKEKEANKKAMSILYGDDDKLTWNCQPDNIWSVRTTTSSIDAAKMYPSPPDEESKTVKRKQSFARNSFSLGKRVKVESGGRECDVFWDFDRV